MSLQLILRLFSAWPVAAACLFVMLLLPITFLLASRRSGHSRKISIAAPPLPARTRMPPAKKASPSEQAQVEAEEEK